jgi:hypothetical protein
VPRVGTLPLAVSATWGSPLDGRAGPFPQAERRIRDARFPRSTTEPEPSSRHLYAGRHLRGKQVFPRFIPRAETNLGFDAIYNISTLHQWFTRVRLLGSYLTHCRRAFSATLTTSALEPTQLAVVWSLPLQGGSVGPTYISAAASIRRVRPPTSTPPSPFVAHASPVPLFTLCTFRSLYPGGFFEAPSPSSSPLPWPSS